MRKMFVLTAIFFSAVMLFAESVTCENENGKCVFEDDGSLVCECADSEDGSSGVGQEPGGDLPTQEECLEMVDDICGLPEGAESCENPAGMCIVYAEGSYACECEDGSYGSNGGGSNPGNSGEGEEDGTEPPQPVDEDEEVPDEYPVEECKENKDCPKNFICENGYCVFDTENVEKPICKDVLVETCGTEAPNINNICDSKTLPYCMDSYSVVMDKCEGEKISTEKLEELKAGKWNEYGKDIADCCKDFEYSKIFFDELLECLKTKDCDECYEQYEEVDEGGDSGGDSGDSGNTGNTGNSDENADNGDTDKEASFEDDTAKGTSDSNSSGCSALIL